MTEADARFDALRARYRASLPDKHAALHAALHAFKADPTDAAARRELSTLVHRLCGSASSYGFAALGDAACEADRLLGDALLAADTPVPERARAFEAAVDAILEALVDAAGAA